MSSRQETCRIYGHYWSEQSYSFQGRQWEELPAGHSHCGWCGQMRTAWFSDPSIYWPLKTKDQPAQGVG